MAIKTIDHMVPHRSTIDASKGQLIDLFVREYDSTPPVLRRGARQS